MRGRLRVPSLPALPLVSPRAMPRATPSRPSAAPSMDGTPQMELFPVVPVVERLDARTLVGPRTGVEHLVRVRWQPEPGPHLVFHDRHGWYCQEHGPTCRAVAVARESVA